MSGDIETQFKTCCNGCASTMETIMRWEHREFTIVGSTGAGSELWTDVEFSNVWRCHWGCWRVRQKDKEGSIND